MDDAGIALSRQRVYAQEAAEVFAAAGGIECADGWPAVVEAGLLELAEEPAETALTGAVLLAFGASGVPAPLAEALVAHHALRAAGLPVPDAGTRLAAHLASEPRVPYGSAAERVLVIGEELRWADGGGESFAEPDPAVGASPAPRGAGELLSADPAVVADARARLLVYRSAVLAGVVDAMLELTIAWVSERRQFGRPVGAFQAVAHGLVDVAARLEAGRGLVQAALETPDGIPLRGALAAASTMSEAAVRAVDRCYHFHGTVAHTADYVFHRWARRALALAWPSRQVGRLRAELGGIVVDSVANG